MEDSKRGDRDRSDGAAPGESAGSDDSGNSKKNTKGCVSGMWPSGVHGD